MRFLFLYYSYYSITIRLALVREDNKKKFTSSKQIRQIFSGYWFKAI